MILILAKIFAKILDKCISLNEYMCVFDKVFNEKKLGKKEWQVKVFKKISAS